MLLNARSIALLLLIALLVPSAGYASFNGLPLSSPLEFASLVLLAPLAFGRASRYAALWLRPVRLSFGLAALIVLVILAKSMALASGTYEGFKGCYRSPTYLPPNHLPCEASYENPLRRPSVTRVDRVLDFAPSDTLDDSSWHLGFANSYRFTYGATWPVAGALPWRSRLRFEVDWTGEIAPTSVVVISYVGQGWVRVGSNTVVLHPSYKAVDTVRVATRGSRRLAAHFYFNDRTGIDRLTGAPEPVHGPYASFVARSANGDLLLAAPPSLAWRALLKATDVVLFACLLAVALFWLLLLRRFIWWAPVVGFVVWFVVHANGLNPILPPWIEALGLAITLATLLWIRRRRFIYAAGFTAFTLLWAPFVWFHGWYLTAYPAAGGDPLDYESLARTMLEGWNLVRGGEGVFVHAPAFQWVIFTVHLVFGENDELTFVAAFGTAVLLTMLVFGRIGRRARRLSLPWLAALAGGAFVGALILISPSAALDDFPLGLSEWPTWPALIIAFFLLFASAVPRRWLLGVVLLWFCFIDRPDQLGAISLAYVTFFLMRIRRWPATVLATIPVAGLVALLPAMHDVWYSGHFNFLPSETSSAAIHVLPIHDVLHIFSNASVRHILWRQLQSAFYIQHPVASSLVTQDRYLSIVFHGLAVLWAVAIVAAIIGWRKVGCGDIALLALPAAYLAPYLFYQAAYYPKSIVVGHVAMGLVAAYELGRLAGRESLVPRADMALAFLRRKLLTAAAS